MCSDFHFSPSEYHRHLLAGLTPSLAWRGGDLVAWRRRLRLRLRRQLGLVPAPARPPLDVRLLWSRDHPLGRVEKVVFRAEPYADVPAYVCLPRGAAPPWPFMICLQGHSSGMHNSLAVTAADEQAPLAVAGDRDFALWCLRHGVAALCLEQRSFGERAEKKQAHVSSNRCHDAFVQALMLGRTLLGERVHDVSRGLDYLAARGDADMRRVGVMGNSGGGTTAIYAAALLSRLAFAMPSCSFCTFRDAKMSLYHCACGYAPGLLRYAEMADILGLFAPRPVVIIAGRHDRIIPLAGVRAAFAQLRRIYRAAGAPGRCHLVIGDEGHRFYGAAAWPVMKREIDRLAAAGSPGRKQ